MTKQSKARSVLLSSNMQMVVGFLIPTVVLLYLSDEARLGPLWAMVVALMFPLALELSSLRIRRKPSYISLFAIIGILIIGAISLLGLNEGWLALRRSIVYVVAAVGLVLALRFKPALIDKGLSVMIDMESVHRAAQKKRNQEALSRLISRTVYAFSGFLILIGALGYVSTIYFITAPTGTAEFNAEYAKLRVLSAAVVTLPLLVGSLGILVYLASGIEKLTGLTTEELLKKKS